jgi:hypothetical protein
MADLPRQKEVVRLVKQLRSYGKAWNKIDGDIGDDLIKSADALERLSAPPASAEVAEMVRVLRTYYGEGGGLGKDLRNAATMLERLSAARAPGGDEVEQLKKLLVMCNAWLIQAGVQLSPEAREAIRNAVGDYLERLLKSADAGTEANPAK